MSFDLTKPASRRIPPDAGCGNCRYCDRRNPDSLCCSKDRLPVTEECLCSEWQGEPLPVQTAGRLLQ